MTSDSTDLAALDLTLDERAALLSGQDVWRTLGIDRIGLRPVKVTDGPNGARGDSTTGTTSVCLPASIALGASFDVDLVAELGGLLGREVARKASHVLLAPTINLARHPLGGRNFESFGEDPRLTADLAVAYVTGVQSEGVGACAKHFVANDVEFARMTVSSEVDETVLREVYLLPFEAVVDAGVWTVMASYPMLNGIHCTEHHWLLTDVLRHQWGFDGLVMSDWGATHHRSRPIEAGLDLEMPGPPLALGPHLVEAVADGELAEDVVDARVANVLTLARRAGRFPGPAAAADGSAPDDDDVERSIDLDDERHLARRAATEGMVLLTNDGTLPADPDRLTSVALIGPNAVSPTIQGGGSAQVSPHRIATPLDGLAARLPSARIEQVVGCLSHRYLPPVEASAWVGDDRPIELALFDTDALDGATPFETRTARSIAAFVHGLNTGDTARIAAQRWTGRLRAEVGGRHTFSVLAVGRSRVLIDEELVVDNWTAPKPGDAYFQMASAEALGTVDLEAGTEVEVTVEWAPDHTMPLAGLRFGHLPPVDEDALLDEAVVAAAGADLAVVVVGLTNEWETEGHDRSSFSLPGRQDELVRRVAAANPATVVVINAGGPIDCPWIDDVAATLVAWYPGQELGTALADVLFGDAEPGGRLPLTWPRTLADAPFELPIPEPGPPRPGAVLGYEEGLLIGHRAYQQRGVEPLAPFGHGLGYTTFDLGPAEAAGEAGAGGPVEIRIPVTNTGARPGKCVVQAYVAAPDAASADAARPDRILGAFAAVRPDPGQTLDAVLTVPARAFQRWDDEAGAWVEPEGERRVELGLSSADRPRSVAVNRHAFTAPVR